MYSRDMVSFLKRKKTPLRLILRFPVVIKLGWFTLTRQLVYIYIELKQTTKQSALVIYVKMKKC